MKRIKMLGLCIVAIFALSATIVATAQAGKYNEGPVKVLDQGEGTAELGNSVANIKCESHSASSEVISATQANNVVSVYNGCKAAGVPCENTGPGQITTEKLKGVINWIKKSEGRVGADFRPENTAPESRLASFNCAGFAFVRVYGSIIGEITSATNVMTETGHLSFKESGFKNQPEEFEGGPKEFLKAAFEPPTAGKESEGVPSGQIQEDNTTNHKWKCKVKKGVESCKKGDMAELRISTGTPEYGRCEKNGAGTKYVDTNCTQLPVGKAKAKYGFVAP